MKPVKFWLNPSRVGELQNGKFLFVSINSIFSDNDKRTIWIDLENPNFSLKIPRAAFIYGIKRKSVGESSDFQFLPNTFTGDYMTSNKALNILSDSSFWDHFSNERQNFDYMPISEKVNFIFRLLKQIGQAKSKGQDIPLPDDIMKKLELSELDLKMLENIKIFIEQLPKKPIQDLLMNGRYSLILGNLTIDESMENKVATEEDIIVKPKITSSDVASLFDGVILDMEIKEKIYSGLSLPDILNGKKPKTGGVILIDHGGTGKSLIKKQIIKLFKKMGAETKEKSQGDITSYVNAGPQVIKKWYRGGSSSEVTGREEVDLVAIAKKKGIPSLLVIDESEEFIRERKDSRHDPVNALNTLKKYIQDAEKGGVTGYVLTLLIANIDAEEIHAPLQQGAERLTLVYLGPPNSIRIWNDVIKYIVEENKLDFEKNFNSEILAKILFEFQKNVSHERYAITPRKLGAYCSEYYTKHTETGSKVADDFSYFEKIMKKNENSKVWRIDFRQFLNHIIEELLSEELSKDPQMRYNKDNIIKEYIRYADSIHPIKEIGVSDNVKREIEESNEISIEDVKKYFEDALRFNAQSLLNFKKPFNEDLINSFGKNLYTIQMHMGKYFELKGIKFDEKELIRGFQNCHTMLERWRRGIKENNSFIPDQSEYDFISRFIINLKNNLRVN